jgi:adenylate cyclase
MSERSYCALREAVQEARDLRNVAVLRQCAAELGEINTMEALALRERTLGIAAMYARALDEAIAHYGAGIELYTSLGDNEGLAAALADLAYAHVESGDFTTALDMFTRALAMAEELGDRRLLASTFSNIGVVLVRTGNYPRAMEYLQQGLMLHEELGNTLRVAHTTVSIGLMYQDMHEHHRAAECYERALSMYEELDFMFGVVLATNNIACSHLFLHDYDHALVLFRRCRDQSVALGDANSIIRCDVNVAYTLVRSGSFAEAQAILTTLDGVVIDEPSTYIKREESRAAIQEAEGHPLLAVETLHSLLAYAKDRSIHSSMADIHRQLRELAQRRQDFAGYIEHNTQFLRITEEINGKDTATKLAMLSKQREIDAREREHAQHLAVLHATLPKHVAERVVRGEQVNDRFTEAAVLFIDIVDFTDHTSNMDASEVIVFLEGVFSTFDAICEQHGVTKVKTIGDSYMCFRGDADAATNALSIANVGIDIMHVASGVAPGVASGVAFTWPSGKPLQLRIRIHIGPAAAGVIGTQRLQYDVWGDTVNVASRMESTGEPGCIQVSEAFADALRSSFGPAPYTLIQRGVVEVKGKGAMQTYWLK